MHPDSRESRDFLRDREAIELVASAVNEEGKTPFGSGLRLAVADTLTDLDGQVRRKVEGGGDGSPPGSQAKRH